MAPPMSNLAALSFRCGISLVLMRRTFTFNLDRRSSERRWFLLPGLRYLRLATEELEIRRVLVAVMVMGSQYLSLEYLRRFSKLSVVRVTEALARAGLESSSLIVGIDFTKSNEWTGLESSKLIVGIDFTKSNEWTGAMSFNSISLQHFIGSSPNPYEQAIPIIGRTLTAVDEDNLIPCYGFGDASTHDQDAFSFNPEDRFCNGFEEVLVRYKISCLNTFNI